jgi:DnaJ-class molecular chaperone
MVAQPARKCPHCQGTGAMRVGEFEDRCRVCAGSGWSHVFKQGSISH